MKRPFSKKQNIGVSLQAAFEYHVVPEPNSGCWIWCGSQLQHGGYGSFTMRPMGVTRRRAHRVAWEIYVGQIPDEAHVLHHCDNPLCVNPGHLFLGDQAANMRDKALKGRQRMGWDHPSVKHGRYIGDKQNPEYHQAARIHR